MPEWLRRILSRYGLRRLAPAPTAADRRILAALHRGLAERSMPESVARDLLQLPAIAADGEMAARLRQVADARLPFSAMSENWFAPVAPRRKIALAHTLFAEWIAANPSPAIIGAEERDPARIRGFLAHLSGALGKPPGRNDFRNDRLIRAERRAIGIGFGNHAYNKRFRLLTRLEAHLATYEKELRLLRWRRIGKTGLATAIPFDAFAASIWGAAFIAYITATGARRSEFTITPQARAFDEIAEALLQRCARDPRTDWAAIARAHPDRAVLARLDGEAVGRLIGEWLAVLADIAGDLEAAWKASAIDLDSMVVQPGNDSSTWNLTAQAWNTARKAWMALLAASGQQGLLAAFCPGKVLRLMAADVAAWHRRDGTGIHPDTLVWRRLPKPWQVLRGEADCTRAMVEEACRDAAVDPRAGGWIEASIARRAAPFRPTPELVHGVAVGSPYLALVLRRMGVFSGKALKALPEADLSRET